MLHYYLCIPTNLSTFFPENVMTLPLTNIDEEIYLQEVLQFLQEQNWLFSYPNTHLLVKEVFSKIDDSWLMHLKNLTSSELNEIPFGLVNVRHMFAS